MSERTARVILVVIVCGVMWGIVAAFPWVAYVIVGVLGTLGCQALSRWTGRRRESGAAPEDAVPEPISALDIVEALHEVSAPHAFLADLAAALDVPKETARALVENLGIRVRRAVRNGDDTAVGVHRDDLPPLPRLSPEDPETGVDQGQPTNQRVTVEELGLAGRLVKDGSETTRRHRVQ
ncbi:hypothetical protein ACIQNU_02375 [Streptomyces sp. NPDC091292]|uniref:hypothetical protein n=1 Tax=Streptomyces sp. NPDC091292 TaxID=3365991 RepID=UPI00381F0BEA